MTYYVLNEDKTVRQVSAAEWRDAFNRDTRRVAEDTVGDYWVSTVFLGLDHSLNGAPPLLFETMVFRGDKSDLDSERYSTWQEAVAGHAAMVAKWRAKADGAA